MSPTKKIQHMADINKKTFDERLCNTHFDCFL